MDTMNSVIEVLFYKQHPMRGYDKRNITEPVSELIHTIVFHEMYHLWPTVIEQAGEFYLSPSEKAIGYMSDDVQPKSPQQLELAMPWHQALRYMEARLSSMTRISFNQNIIAPEIKNYVEQADRCSGTVYTSAAENREGKLMLRYGQSSPDEYSAPYGVVVDNQGFWLEAHSDDLGENCFFSTNYCTLPILNEISSRQKVSKHLRDERGNGYEKVCNWFKRFTADSYSHVYDVPMFSAEILLILLSSKLVPGISEHLALYLAKERADIPEAILTRHRIQRLKNFVYDKYNDRSVLADSYKLDKSRLDQLVAIPLSSDRQDCIIDSLTMVEENKHLIMAKLIQLAATVQARKAQMSLEVYDSLLSCEKRRQSPMANFYRFIMIATPIVWPYCTDSMAEDLIRHVETAQESLIDVYDQGKDGLAGTAIV